MNCLDCFFNSNYSKNCPCYDKIEASWPTLLAFVLIMDVIPISNVIGFKVIFVKTFIASDTAFHD